MNFWEDFGNALSSHNQNEMLKKQAQKHQRFTIKKLSVGVASVLIGLAFMGASSVSADTNTQSDAANQPAVVNTDKGAQNDNHATTNQPISENNAAAAKDTNTQAAANNNQTTNQATANVTPAAENNNNQAAEAKVPNYYNITVNFHDVTRGGNIQVLNKRLVTRF